jgi:hypothetical protein
MPQYQTHTLRAKVQEAYLPHHVQSIELGKRGTITVTMAGSVIDGKAFVLQPSGNENHISWRCECAGIAASLSR